MRRLSVAVRVLLVAGLAAGNAPAQERRSGVELERALTLLEEALEELKELRKAEAPRGDLANAYLQLALAQLSAGDREAALRSLVEVTRLDSRRRLDPEVYSAKVLDLFAEARSETATLRAQEPQPVGFGNLAVTSDAWVHVSVDGGAPQETPVVFPRLRAARHTVRAFRPGFREQVVEVVVPDRDSRRLHLTLEKEPKRE